MLKLAPLSTRNQYGQLLNDMGLTGEAVEIGTHRGDFAAVLLTHWHGKLLRCIDPWTIPPGYEDQAKHLWGDGGRQEDKRVAVERLSEFGGRTDFHVGLSQDLVESFADRSLDFVYVDGDHSAEAVDRDIRDWWPKIKPGGMLAGHDFMCPGEFEGGWGQFIQPVVTKFAAEHNVDVYLVVEEAGAPWSFHIHKPLEGGDL